MAAPLDGGDFRARAFGLRWASPVPLPLFPAEPDPSLPPEIAVTLETGPPPPAAPRLDPSFRVQHLPDGIRYTDPCGLLMDAIRGTTVRLFPAESWSGSLPFSFFSTVTGLLLAMRGLLPLHGSAVEQDGAATLFCGPAGAGKSTFAAQRLEQGARLLSDDLTVLHPDSGGGPPRLFPGRSAIRLHPDTAARLVRALPGTPAPEPLDGKLAVRPPVPPPEQSFPLRRIIVLGQQPGPLAEADRADVLLQQLFRPQWQRRLPGRAAREVFLRLASHQVDIEGHVTFSLR